MEDNYYDSISEGYEELHREEQEKKMKIILSEVKVSQNDMLLDVGCGTGITTIPWNCKRTGLDPAKKLLERANEKENVNYVHAKAEDIPFGDNTFDVVTSVTAIQNFSDIKKGLSEIKRVGKKRFVLTFLRKSPKHEYIDTLIKNMFIVKKVIEEDKDMIYICEKMKTEIETKILEIDVNNIKKRLNELGAKHLGEHFQKRHVYDFNPAKENSWIRLRTNGFKTTLTIKEIENDSIDGTKEIEVEVDDFEKTNQLLNKLGYISKAYQENKRESYFLDDVNIEIDTWPMIPPYMELECDSISKIEGALGKLGFSIEHTTSINTKEVYKKYSIDLPSIKELKF